MNEIFFKKSYNINKKIIIKKKFNKKLKKDFRLIFLSVLKLHY